MIGALAELRPGEARRVLLAGAWFCCLLTGNATLRPLRDAMGLAGGVDALPWLFTATFVTMLAVIPLHGLAVARLGRGRLVAVIHHGFALQLLLFFVLMQGWLGDAPMLRLWTARVFFVWTSVFNLFVISLFWSVMADLFSGADARRLFGLIAAGGSIGAIVGPGLAGLLALWLGPATLPLVVVVLLEIAAACMRRLGTQPATADPHDPHADAPVGGSPFAAIPEILRSPPLLRLCAYVLLATACATLLYLIQARIVAAAVVDDAQRTVLFAAVDFGVNLLALLLQATLTGRLLRRHGLGWALAAAPLICLLGFAALAALPALAILIAVQLLRRAGDYALARPARELIYTGVDRSRRYKAKLVIDTVVYRGGDAFTGWLFAGLQGLGLGLATIAALGLPLAALGLGSARGLARALDRS